VHFPIEDRRLLEEQCFDPKTRPKFDRIKLCLTWPDELPRGISRMGDSLLRELWRIRGFIHRGLSPAEWGPTPSHAQTIWSAAQGDGIRWTGFKRLELSVNDQRFLNSCLASVGAETAGPLGARPRILVHPRRDRE